MKKVDLHIHTVQSTSDVPFCFSQEKLSEYVSSAKLDAIAITNHNLFDLQQFEEITAQTSIDVYPGIEVDVAGSQILVIADKSDLSDFDMKCAQIQSACAVGGSVTLEKFISVFEDLSKYLLIPHYEKRPEIRPETLQRLMPHVTAGEVSSAKKFMYCWKDNDPAP